MSKCARRCDRCRGFFDPSLGPAHTTFKEVILQTGEDFKHDLVTLRMPAKRDDALNLCPECTGAFLEFMKIEPEDRPIGE